MHALSWKSKIKKYQYFYLFFAILLGNIFSFVHFQNFLDEHSNMLPQKADSYQIRLELLNKKSNLQQQQITLLQNILYQRKSDNEKMKKLLNNQKQIITRLQESPVKPSVNFSRTYKLLPSSSIYCFGESRYDRYIMATLT